MYKLHEFAPIVAFVFEPVQGEGGINVPDKELLNELIDYLRKRKICIIADEIQSGLGRTGKMWACEHFGVVRVIYIDSRTKYEKARLEEDIKRQKDEYSHSGPASG